MLPSVVKTTSTVRRSGETGHWGNRAASVVDVERFDSFQCIDDPYLLPLDSSSTFGKARRAVEGAEEPYGTFRARGTKRTSAPFLIAPCGDPDEEKEGRKEGRYDTNSNFKLISTHNCQVPWMMEICRTWLALSLRRVFSRRGNRSDTSGSPSMASSGVAKAESSSRALGITFVYKSC
ncbi:hypothetical protein V1477_001143, partial [Vespula maculifrons]